MTLNTRQTVKGSAVMTLIYKTNNEGISSDDAKHKTNNEGISSDDAKYKTNKEGISSDDANIQNKQRRDQQ